MKTTAVLACLALVTITAEAQYQAILSPPTAPVATQTGTGNLNSHVGLRAIGGGYGWGQYLGSAVKVSLFDGSITSLSTGLPLPTGTPDISAALATDGIQAVGYAWSTGSQGTGKSCIHWDANGVPTLFKVQGWFQSACNATNGVQYGGYVENDNITTNGFFPTSQHAMIWNSPTSFVDLRTGGYNYSQVLGMSGTQQVGFQSTSQTDPTLVAFGTQFQPQIASAAAFLWHGSNSGAVNLQPAGFTASVAFATNGAQQGGYAYNSTLVSRLHAMLWSGTAASAIDLNPANWYDTEVRGLSMTSQVGDGYERAPNGLNGNRHALLWSGTPDSVVDLNPYLPLGYTNAVADTIDASGNIVGHAWAQIGQGYSFAPVIFTPQPASPSQLLSVTLSALEINEGDTVQATVTLAGPAPADGQLISLFACSSEGFSMLELVQPPATVLVPEGQTAATFAIPTNRLFLRPSAATNQSFNNGGQYWVRVYANDGTVSRFAPLKVDMVPFMRSLAIPSPLNGGSSTTGTLLISGTPFPSGNAIVSLTSDNPAVLTVPASVTITPASPVSNASFSVTAAQVTTTTVVSVTASIDGTSMTVSVTVLPAPPATLTGISVTQEVIAGNPYSGTLSFSGPVPFGGATVNLTSDNPLVVPVPATVSAVQGQSSISFSGVTGPVTSSVTAHITAAYNGVSLTAPITVSNEPPVTITVAEYDTISLVVKVEATTNIPNSTLSFGFDPSQGPVVAMSLSSGVWSGSLKNVTTAPTIITVWNSNGGSVSVAPTLRAK